MKLTHLLPLLAIVGVGAVAVRAQDLISSTAGLTTVAANDAPSTRLGAELSKDLTADQKKMADRASQLDMREQLLEAARTRAAAEAKATPPATQASRDQVAEDEEQAIENLVKVYQSMKPKRAAVIFERLDLSIQVAVASKMRNQATAAIMAAMSPDAAGRLTTALAQPSSRQPQIKVDASAIPAANAT